jgi:hypothetical protein
MELYYKFYTCNVLYIVYNMWMMYVCMMCFVHCDIDTMFGYRPQSSYSYLILAHNILIYIYINIYIIIYIYINIIYIYTQYIYRYKGKS